MPVQLLADLLEMLRDYRTSNTFLNRITTTNSRQQLSMAMSSDQRALVEDRLGPFQHSRDDVLNQNYIKAAATRGLSRFTIIRRHVLHNALPPIVPKLGLQFSTMLTLAMITEMVFSWPGLGRWLINAIRQQDYAAISAGVMVIGTLVITINVLADILGAATTPLKHKEWYALR